MRLDVKYMGSTLTRLIITTSRWSMSWTRRLSQSNTSMRTECSQVWRLYSTGSTQVMVFGILPGKLIENKAKKFFINTLHRYTNIENSLKMKYFSSFISCRKICNKKYWLVFRNLHLLTPTSITTVFLVPCRQNYFMKISTLRSDNQNQSYFQTDLIRINLTPNCNQLLLNQRQIRTKNSMLRIDFLQIRYKT